MHNKLDQNKSTSIISRVNNFDLIRLVAAFQVVYLHSKGHLNVKNKYLELFSEYFLGYFPGVPIFFMISGFLIYASFERNKNTVRQYFKNRILRIFPALWVCIILCASLILFSNKTSEILNSSYFYVWLLGQFSVFQFYTPDILRFWGVGTPNGSLWTITVEIQFYLIIPLIYWLVNKVKYGWWIFILLGGGSIITNYYLGKYEHTDNIYTKLGAVSLLPYLYYFLIGISANLYWSKIKHFFHDKFTIWFLGYLFFSLTLSNGLGYDTVSYWVSSPLNLIADVLLTGVVLSAAFSMIGLSKYLLKGYDISYGIYIYHMLVVNVFVHYGLSGNVQYLFSTWLITLLLAWLSWVYIEKPVLKLK